MRVCGLDLFTIANKAGAPEDWLAAALPLVAAEAAADYAAVAASDDGRWNALAASGQPRPLPGELLADALDRETVQLRGEWAAGPLAPRGDRAEALVLHWPKPPAAETAAVLAALLPAVREALVAVRTRWQQSGRIRRLEAIVEIAQQWNRTRELETLLVQIAEAATRLFQCDRASIFLWDRPNRAVDRPSCPGRQRRRAPRGRRPRRGGPRAPIGPSLCASTTPPRPA